MGARVDKLIMTGEMAVVSTRVKKRSFVSSGYQ
jgi:hypothetical protein